MILINAPAAIRCEGASTGVPCMALAGRWWPCTDKVVELMATTDTFKASGMHLIGSRYRIA